MHGRSRAPLPLQLPFVRSSKHHVYAQDNGPFYEVGTYNHRPLRYGPLTASVLDERVDDFQPALDGAAALLPDPTAEELQGAEE